MRPLWKLGKELTFFLKGKEAYAATDLYQEKEEELHGRSSLEHVSFVSLLSKGQRDLL